MEQTKLRKKGRSISFERNCPEQLGIPSRAIMNFIEELEDKEVAMHSFIMLHKGELVVEGYWKPFDENRQHRMYSISKSLTSLAIGCLEEEGKLKLTDKIVDYFRDLVPEEGVHPYIEAMTIQDMLKMATAHRVTTYKQIEDMDWTKTFFVAKPTHLPGTIFSYDTSSTHTLSALIERLSGMSLLDYLKSKLLDPIGCSKEIRWLTCPSNVCQGGSGLICTPRDIARVAQVLLDEGVFEGKQLIPKNYIEKATAKQIETSMQPFLEERQGYGYQFWRTTHNGFVCYGLGGQLAICVPDKAFILVTTADTQGYPTGTSAIYESLWRNIYPYINEEVIEPNEADYSLLQTKLENLQMISVKGESVLALSEAINGKKYVLDKNTLGIEEIRFRFDELSKCVNVEYTLNQNTFKLDFGGESILETKIEEFNLKCVTKVVWVEANTLGCHVAIVDDYVGSLQIRVKFKEKELSLAIKGAGLERDYTCFTVGRQIEA